MDTTVATITYITGTFFVSLFAARFFNNTPYGPEDDDAKNALSADPKLEPALPKYVTEKSRYNIYLSTFIFFTIILYYFVSLVFPALIFDLLKINLQTNHTIALVIGTLGFINLSTKIPYVKNTLTEWKHDLHKRAKIPDKAMYVFDSLRFSEINKSSTQFIIILNKLLNKEIIGKERSDIDESYFFFEKDRIERKWSRLAYLMYSVENWSYSQPFEGRLKNESLKWLALNSYYHDNLIPKMELYRRGLLSEEITADTKGEIETFLIKIYWLITLLLFMTNKAGEDPCIHLKNIQWIVTPEKYFEFSTKQITITGFTILLSILAGAAISSVLLILLGTIESNRFTITPGMVLHWLIYGVPMFVVPLSVTMFTKRYMSMSGVWNVQRPEAPRVPFSERPWDIYLFTSFFSYITTFVILAAVYILLTFSEEAVSSAAISKIATFSVLAFSTSAFICYLLDTPDPGWETNWHYYLKSLFPSLIQGLSNIFIITFSFLLVSIDSFDISSLSPEEFGKLIVYAVIGFIVGITTHLSSRIGTKYYERRDSEIRRSTKGWQTVCVDSIMKRIKILHQSGNYLELIADEELQQIANVGDSIDFYDRSELVLTGNIEAVYADSIRVSLLT
jgi:hypothetical protein